MKIIFVILNGVHLPYHVIDYAIEKSRINNAELYALFLKGRHEHSEKYIFPSDLGNTEIRGSDDEAMKEDEEIISENMKVVQDMAEAKNIPFQSVLITNASIDEIKSITEEASLIIVDENFDKFSILANKKISLQILKKNIAKPIDAVPGK